MLTAEELLAGSSMTFDIQVPKQALRPGDLLDTKEAGGRIRMRPLTVLDLQLAVRAAKENDSLVAALMVQRSLIDPAISVAQAMGLSAGLLQFLLEHVNRISGITMQESSVSSLADAPIAKAAFILARQYGWTPEDVSKLTLGQVLLHLELLKEKG